MPVCKAEAHRALELLEDYYSRLDDSEEKESEDEGIVDGKYWSCGH